MRTIYLKVNRNGMIRKVSIDMAFLSSHNKIRLPKYYFEDGLYLSYRKNPNESFVEDYYLKKDKIKNEDKDFYYFDFPFKVEQVFDISI
jgi:hypothetical protein